MYLKITNFHTAVIIPTLWLYIEKRFDARFYLMGLVLSAYPLSGLVFSPILGKLVVGIILVKTGVWDNIGIVSKRDNTRN